MPRHHVVPATFVSAALLILVLPVACAAVVLAGTSGGPAPGGGQGGAEEMALGSRTVRSGDASLPGMPLLLDPKDVYAADRPNQLSPMVRNDPPRVYVPNTLSDTVTVIDPATYNVIDTIPVGHEPQHVVPS
jgi:YVTN family beta-propeller protein